MLLSTMREKPRSRGERVDVDGVARCRQSRRSRAAAHRPRRAPPASRAKSRRSGAACDEEEMRDEHRLRRAEVRERRHQRVARRRRLRRERVDHARATAALQQRNPAPQVEPQIERDLLVARSAGVQPAAGVAEPLDQLALDEAVDVLVVARRRTPDRARPRSRSSVERRLDLRRVLGASARRPSRSARAHARLPVTSSSNRRRSKRNEAPNSNAAASGAVSKRPDQRLVISRHRQSLVVSRASWRGRSSCGDA